VAALVDELNRRKTAAFAFFDIMAKHAKRVEFDNSLAAWSDKRADSAVANEALVEMVFDANYRKDNAATAILLIADCRSFANEGSYHNGSRQLPALYRAIARDSSFGDALQEFIETSKKEEERLKKDCCHRIGTNDWAGPLVDKITAAFKELPVCVWT